MFVKFVAFLVLVAVASASNFNSFSYSVADPYTGDFKNQIESRAGDNVKGQYSLLEADGTRRTVDYAAGAEGFNAIVHKDPALIATAPVVSPLSYAASPLSYAASPLSYAASPLSYASSPLAYAAAPAKFSTYGYGAPIAAPFPHSRYLY